ncbi:unnamed protein product [Brachionus calyciflorus]|uniref:C3H1-type domain-containing protein n=1 Tax=Brachionus calyciflorus TaxID=104777 RepID=A0A813N8T5_9BILA|nr:unnamed protein product [Brachionus calyciflorus]
MRITESGVMGIQFLIPISELSKMAFVEFYFCPDEEVEKSFYLDKDLMSDTVDIDNLPIINLNKENIEREWMSLVDSINESSFISLDIEMSGLGERKKLNNPSIEERYKSIKEAASKFSILSFGISCFKIHFINEEKILQVENKTFNLALNCCDYFMIDPESVKFLISCGHDFNYYFQKGIEYYKGNDRKDDNTSKQFARNLIVQISAAEKPIVLHNGLIDLIFLYENLYAKTPDNLMKFVADVREIFKTGIYDTKFISDFYDRSQASYLEYMFYKSLYENTKRTNKNVCFKIKFGDYCYLSDFGDNDENELNENLICKQYFLHGYCSRLTIEKCDKIHDIKRIFRFEINKKMIKRNKNGCDKLSEMGEILKVSSLDNETISIPKGLKHNAGCDAFMTGYVMLYFINKFSNVPNKGDLRKILLSEFDGLERFNFNLNLSGKDYPLIIQKSNFNSVSVQHQEKKLRISKKE